ncbi:MAG: hypothetical protein R3A80_13855 [Bdellovibrionota bacterium]
MKNNLTKTRAELLLITAVVFGIAACSGGKKGNSSTSVVLTDDVVLDLPEDRALVKETQKSSNSLFELGTDESGVDARVEKGSALGSEMLARLNLFSAKAGGSEDASDAVDGLLESLLKKDVESARAKFAAAQKEALSRRDSRLNEVTAKFGGADAVSTLTLLKEGSDVLINRKIKEANALVDAVNAYDAESAVVSAAMRARAGEMKDLEGKIQVLKKKIEAVEAGQDQKVEVKKSILQVEIDLLTAKVELLKNQIAILEKDFKKAFDARRKEYTSFVVNVPFTGKRFIGKTDAEIEKEVIAADPELKIMLDGSARLKKQLAQVNADKAAKVRELTTADLLKIGTAPELKAELAKTEKTLASYLVTVKPFWGDVITTKYYLLNGAFVSESEMNQKLLSITTARSRSLEELRSLDPKNIPTEIGKPTKQVIAEAAQRSAEFYRDMIKDAFAEELKKFDELQKARGEVATKLQGEVTAAQYELSRAEDYLKEYRNRLSVALKAVSGCQEAVLSDAESSRRVIVDSVSVNASGDLVTSLGSFEDFTRVEEQNEYADAVTVAYKNTNDFSRFVYLILDDRSEVVGFETSSKLSPLGKTVKGTGTVNIEYRSEENPEDPTFVQGEMDYTVDQFKSSFATPVSDLAGNEFTVALCVQNKKGGFELKKRKVIVRDVAKPAVESPANDETEN